MSENVKKNTTDEKEIEKTEKTEKKVVAKAKVTKAEDKKPNIFQRGWAWAKKNKKPIAACAASFVAGGATAVGVGVAMNKRAERKAREAYIEQPMTQPEETLDPNI